MTDEQIKLLDSWDKFATSVRIIETASVQNLGERVQNMLMKMQAFEKKFVEFASK